MQSTETPFPEIHNTPDAICFNDRQCSDAEFADSVNGMKKQWEMAPEWLRAACASNHTGPTLFDCIVDQTVAWLKFHPDAKAPWLAPDAFKAR
jgi:hypothetical protein